MKPIGCLVAGAALALAPFAAHAQAEASGYPSKPVRLIVGFTPGSATDVTARLLAQKLNEAWAVAATVENVPGAGKGAVIVKTDIAKWSKVIKDAGITAVD